ncbi:hypothetical protein A7G45_17775 [Mycolicibacterium llatzerense]|nr:hypothetical protein [Mycolicibacterium llatzerense]
MEMCCLQLQLRRRRGPRGPGFREWGKPGECPASRLVAAGIRGRRPKLVLELRLSGRSSRRCREPPGTKGALLKLAMAPSISGRLSRKSERPLATKAVLLKVALGRTWLVNREGMRKLPTGEETMDPRILGAQMPAVAAGR